MTDILMKRGASVMIKNKFGSSALDEAKNNEIRIIIKEYLDDPRYQFISDIRSYFPCGCQELFDDQNNEIGFYVENPHNDLGLHYELETFHGTQLKNVLSIMCMLKGSRAERKFSL